ncbi:MAG: ParA family protein [Acidimicrobiia bacterium]
MSRVLAVANQKGGVAKTTTTHSLGVALAELGERVLLVDLDPQACLTYSVGIDPDTRDGSLHDVLAGRLEVADVLTKAGDLSVLPKSVRFAEAPGRGRSILEHAPRSAGAEAYRTIARTLHQELR